MTDPPESNAILPPQLVADLGAANVAVRLEPVGAWDFEPGQSAGPTHWKASAVFAHKGPARVLAPVGHGLAEAPAGAASATAAALRALAEASGARAARVREGAARLSEGPRAEALERACGYDAEARSARELAERFSPTPGTDARRAVGGRP